MWKSLPGRPTAARASSPEGQLMTLKKASLPSALAATRPSPRSSQSSTNTSCIRYCDVSSCGNDVVGWERPGPLKPEACPVVLLWLVTAIHWHSTAAGTAMFAPLTWWSMWCDSPFWGVCVCVREREQIHTGQSDKDQLQWVSKKTDPAACVCFKQNKKNMFQFFPVLSNKLPGLSMTLGSWSHTDTGSNEKGAGGRIYLPITSNALADVGLWHYGVSFRGGWWGANPGLPANRCNQWTSPKCALSQTLYSTNAHTHTHTHTHTHLFFFFTKDKCHSYDE